MQKIEHIGIAVKDLEQAEKFYSILLKSEPYKREVVEGENVTTSFLKNGPNKIELIASEDKDNTINKFIAKKGEGIHHVAFAVQDILSEMQRLKSAGFQLLSGKPKIGADNKLICLYIQSQQMGFLLSFVKKYPNKWSGMSM